jgi:hypothetical protein
MPVAGWGALLARSWPEAAPTHRLLLLDHFLLSFQQLQLALDGLRLVAAAQRDGAEESKRRKAM